MAKAVTIPVNAVKQKSSAGLGLVPLVALVVGSMIGGGVFSLPQNMAKGASPRAVIKGWLIAGIGRLEDALEILKRRAGTIIEA